MNPAMDAASASFLPTRIEHELLQAALLNDREEVVAAFTRWKAAIEFDEIEIGSLRLIPLLYRNLSRFGVNDELMPRFRGIYKQVWFRNQWILKEGTLAVSALRQEGIPTLVIKGAGLVATVYDDAALRPMEDFDLVVHRSDFRRALAIVTGLGWKGDPGIPDPESHLEFEHATGLRRDGLGNLDLHWASTWGAFDIHGEDAFWDHAEDAVLIGERVRVLAAPDQLLQVCAHAAQWNAMAPIRWVADSVFILKKAGESFDWKQLVEVARVRSLSLNQIYCLEYLRDGLGVSLPEKAVDALRRNVRLRERALFGLKISSRARRRWYAAIMWLRLIFLDGLAAVPGRLGLFRRYLRSAFRVPAGEPLLRFLRERLSRPPEPLVHPRDPSQT